MTTLMSNHEKINYVEFPCLDLGKTKAFFSTAFAWKFEDYGPDYIAFSDAGLTGGFFRAKQAASTEKGSTLVVLYSADLEGTQQKITQNGGEILKKIFSFPGGRRFHFQEPGGNELAVWSDKDPVTG